VDVLGTFHDAVEIAAEKAGISDDYRVRYYPAQKTFVEQLMKDLGMSAKVKIGQWQAGEMYPYLQFLERIRNYKGTQARMSWEGDFSF
jgi:protease-4